MKTDRELIELAAKAAGIPITWSKNCFGNETGPWIHNSGWNPLTDDGDNARLETKLEIEVRWHEDGVEAGKRGDSIGVFVFYEDTEYDKDKARRQASVTFAAAIGESMP